MIDLTWAAAGQILVTIVLGVVVGLAFAAGVLAIYCQYQESRERYDRRMELRRRAIRDDEDEIIDDPEHMRVVREHESHRSIPYRRGAV